MKTKLNFSQLTKQFDYVNSDIEANFPLTEPRSSEYRLFHFDRYVTSEKAIEEIEKEGYSVATLSELLLWKEWNGKDWVMALGSVAEVSGSRRVAGLGRRGSRRGLYLFWFGRRWYVHCRFLAVRVSEPKTLEKVGDLDSLTLPGELTINGKLYRQV